jgi:hypothetical protein
MLQVESAVISNGINMVMNNEISTKVGIDQL